MTNGQKLFTLLLIIGAVFFLSDKKESEANRDVNAIANYISCVSGSKTIEINSVDKEMTEGNMIAICVARNVIFRETVSFKNNAQSYREKICSNKKPFNRDVILHDQFTDDLIKLAGEKLEQSNYFYTAYTANQRSAYWKERDRVSGEEIIC